MKLQAPRNVLLGAFGTVGAVVPSRTPKEILKNVKLSVADGKATLVGMDGEVGIRYQFPEVQTNSSGEALLPTQRVNSILRELSNEEVTIEVDQDKLSIRGGRSQFQLSSEDPAEFPDVSVFNDTHYFVIPGKGLKAGIQKTLFAADVESTRYALGGVLMELTEKHVTLAATDSRRLAVYRTACSVHGGTEESMVQAVIPSKAMSLIEKTIQSDDQDVHVAVHKNDVLIRSGNSTIYSRLVEGRFPRYQDVIPTSVEVTIDLVAGPFHSAVKQAMIVTNEESRGVDFNFSAGTLVLKSTAADVGTSQVELPISYEGEPLGVTFDPRFVADFLKTLESSAPVVLKLIDSNTAAVFTADEQYTYVVMPLARD